MTIRYAKTAIRDIAKITSQIAKRSPASAARVANAIRQAIRVCADFPRASPMTDVPTLHRSALGKYRNTIFYRLWPGKQGIEVVRVLHSSRVKDLRKLPAKD